MKKIGLLLIRAIFHCAELKHLAKQNLGFNKQTIFSSLPEIEIFTLLTGQRTQSLLKKQLSMVKELLIMLKWY